MLFNTTKGPSPTGLTQEKERSIVRWALGSRVIIITLQFLSNLLIPDHSPDAFLYPKENLTRSPLDDAVQTFLGGLNRWDAQYFMHIARHGYTFENTSAFFPLLPLITRFASTIAWQLLPLLNAESVTLLTFVIINVYFFVEAARVLFRLTSAVTDVSFAHKTSILFCFNPASIFFTAPYAECLFSYLTFKSILTCMNNMSQSGSMGHLKFKDALACIIYVGLSTCARSNGLLNVGFFVYFFLSYVFARLIRTRGGSEAVIFLVRSTLELVAYVFLCALPFVIVQFYHYGSFCGSFDNGVPQFLVDFASEHRLVLPGFFHLHNQTWCHSKIPLAYAYVQEHYWNVGFLRYYELRQVPNFLLAAPVVYIVIENGLDAFGKILKRLSRMEFVDLFNNVVFVCTVHVFALTIFCVFFVHVQVTTRMVFSASPAVYWFCAEVFTKRKSRRKRLCLKYYFFSYFVVGTVMFSNYLPWT